MEIREVDPRDEGLLRAWHAVYDSSQSYQRPHASPWRYEELLVSLRDPGSRRRMVAYVGLAGAEVVCAGALTLPMLDNTSSAGLDVDTAPDRRGTGCGTAMLTHLESAAARHGRTLMNAEVSYPYDADTSADLDFATRRGYQFGLGDVMRVLDLPTPTSRFEQLIEDAAPHHAAYELRTFRDRVPDDIVTSFAALNALLAIEAPTGDNVREAESADVGALREDERVRVEQGRTAVIAVALHQDEVVALTALGTSVHEPDRAYQWATLVARAHRGHRLGLAVKAANLLALQRQFPAVRRVLTWNAEVNAHMVGINEQLGFRPVERLAELQKRLELP